MRPSPLWESLVPRNALALLKRSKRVPAKTMRDVAVLFVDIEGCTRLCEDLTLREMNAVRETYFSEYLCTETVARPAKGLEDIQCREVGSVHFRNIVDPVRIFEVIAGPGCDQTTVVDPVCRMHVTPETATPYFSFGGTTYYFCSLGCARAFAERPHLYAGEAGGR